jgi:hypothetical protein
MQYSSGRVVTGDSPLVTAFSPHNHPLRYCSYLHLVPIDEKTKAQAYASVRCQCGVRTQALELQVGCWTHEPRLCTLTLTGTLVLWTPREVLLFFPRAHQSLLNKAGKRIQALQLVPVSCDAVTKQNSFCYVIIIHTPANVPNSLWALWGQA